MILMLAALATEANPPGSVDLKLENVDILTAPYVAAYGQCFQDAAIDTYSSPLPERQRRYNECRATRPALSQRFELVKTRGHLRAARNLEVSMNKIEAVFEKALHGSAVSRPNSPEASK